MAQKIVCFFQYLDLGSSIVSHNDGVRLSGILYMHCIMESRFGASASRYLSLLQQIVGEKNLPNIHLVTTMVNRIHPEEVAKRHKELRRKHWAALIRNGATMYTEYEGTTESARDLLNSIELKAIVPALQKEVAIENKPLQKTKTRKDLYTSFRQYILEYIKKRTSHLEPDSGSLPDNGSNGRLLFSDLQNRFSGFLTPTDSEDQENTVPTFLEVLQELDDAHCPEIVDREGHSTAHLLADLCEVRICLLFL